VKGAGKLEWVEVFYANLTEARALGKKDETAEGNRTGEARPGKLRGSIQKKGKNKGRRPNFTGGK